MRGITPAGVVERSDVTITTRSPMPTPSAFANSVPSTMPYSPGWSAPKEPVTTLSAMAVTLRSSSGNTPVTTAPLVLLPPPISSAWSSMKGAAPSTCGFVRTRAAALCQSCSRKLAAVMLACEVRLRMRSRTSRSKPFITDSTTISTATPIASPAIEIVEMKETKRLPRLARR